MHLSGTAAFGLAASLVVVNNQSSSDPQPSDGDLRATRDLVRACATMDLKLHDHLTSPPATASACDGRGC